jgi:hypothetical protein
VPQREDRVPQLHRSVGSALGAASELSGGHPDLARAVHDAASTAFFDGFQVAVLVAAGIALAGAVMAFVLLPAQPPRAPDAMDDATQKRGRVGVSSKALHQTGRA